MSAAPRPIPAEDGAPEPQAPGGAADLPAEARETRFRILRVGGRRRAFSLEPVFWSILEQAARAHGRRLNDHVLAVVGDAAGNATALLRAHAAAWIEAEHRRLSDLGLAALARRIVNTVPSPAFVIDQHTRIVAHNGAFLDLAGDREGAAPPLPLAVRLRLNLPLADLVRLLQAHPDKVAPVAFTLDFGHLERSGVLTASWLGVEKGTAFVLAAVRDAGAPRRTRPR